MSFCGEDRRRQIKSVFFCLGMAMAACNASQYVIWQLEMKRRPTEEGIKSLKRIFGKNGTIIPIYQRSPIPGDWKKLINASSMTRQKAKEWTIYFNRLASYYLQKSEEF
jgi:hypothetical protein